MLRAWQKGHQEAELLLLFSQPLEPRVLRTAAFENLRTRLREKDVVTVRFVSLKLFLSFFFYLALPVNFLFHLLLFSRSLTFHFSLNNYSHQRHLFESYRIIFLLGLRADIVYIVRYIPFKINQLRGESFAHKFVFKISSSVSVINTSFHCIQS